MYIIRRFFIDSHSFEARYLIFFCKVAGMETGPVIGYNDLASESLEVDGGQNGLKQPKWPFRDINLPMKYKVSRNCHFKATLGHQI